MKEPKLNPYVVGMIGLLAMIIFYFALLWLTTKDPLHPFYFFGWKWYFLAPLFLGFGLQMYLFQKLRYIIHQNNVKMAVASAGTSGLAMAACCAHHIADFLPILGFAGIASTMTKYQDWFLVAGVLINLIGVIYMWSRIMIQKKMHCAVVEPVINN
ncbi:MAG: hypothetical protein Q8P20_01500 [bacterium]|nr:hypothetical protein [bacterium]